MMTTKIWIKIAIIGILIFSIVTLSALYSESRKHVVTLKNHIVDLNEMVENQEKIIDSLLARRMTVFDVSLSVTDRSRNVIYGRYNRMSQEKTYELKIDSTSVTLK